jgi:hypothetical protein
MKRRSCIKSVMVVMLNAVFSGATLALARSASEHLKIGLETLRALGNALSG